jgi:hypothetical protein
MKYGARTAQSEGVEVPANKGLSALFRPQKRPDSGAEK